MVGDINEILKTICWNLSRGDVCNYVVDIKIFHSNQTKNVDEAASIKKILGDYAEVDGIEAIDLTEVLKAAKEGFYFSGDESAYPNKHYLFSSKFKVDTDRALKKIEELFSDSLSIFIFWLKQGHPFYPVFWDYAFLIRKEQDDFLFIGSSSD